MTDAADLLAVLVIALVITAGCLSFAVAGLVGGAVAAVVALAVRRGPAGRTPWQRVAVAGLAATAGLVAGPAVLVGSIVLWSVLEPVLGELPLLYPAWAAAALAGGVSRVALPARPAPTG